MSAPIWTWWRLGMVAAFSLGLCIAAWQRWQIGRLVDERERLGTDTKRERVAMTQPNSPTRDRPVGEVRAEIESAFDQLDPGATEERETETLRAARLLSKVSTTELESAVRDAEPASSAGAYQFVNLALGELAIRDPIAALDTALEADIALGTELELPARAGGILHVYALSDPDGAFRWLGELEERFGDRLHEGHIKMLREIVEQAVTTAEMHRDPLQALKKALVASRKDTTLETWRQYSDCVGPEHWVSLVEFGATQIEPAEDDAPQELSYDSGVVFDIVATSMLHRLGFERAWEEIGGLGLTEEQSFAFEGVLVAAELGPHTPERAAKWLEQVPEAERLDRITRIARGWARTDGVAAAAWLAAFSPATDSALERLTRMVITNQPQQAAHMALQVPDASKRTALLDEVLERWSKNDPRAAGLFVAEQGAAAAAEEHRPY